MKRRNLILNVIFIFIVIVELAGRFFDSIALEYPVKPLIMVWIAIYFLLNARKRSLRIPALLAFFFSWIGDLLLMFSDGYSSEMLFYAGVGGFFFAQLSYIFLFLYNAENSIKGFILRNPFWFLPIIVYGVLIYYILFPDLEGLLVPIILIYAISLICMSLAALNRRDRVGNNSFQLVFIGSLFFLASDSMIALNKFHAEIPYAGLLIMASYILAQYLIMRGLILEKNMKNAVQTAG